MANIFPKYNSSRLTSERGVTLVKKIIENEFNWIFRPTPLEHDFGIDGYIDIVNESQYITGKSIAIQIKTGKSYFERETKSGWEFVGETKHLNYYLNLNHPVLIVLVNLDSELIFWTEFDINKITQNKTGWTIRILKKEIFDQNYKEHFYSLPGLEIDYLPQIEYQWALNKEITQSGIIILAIDKSEIVQMNLTVFNSLLTKFTSSDEMIQKCKEKLSFGIFGYEEDKRELYQIKEVRDWVKAIIPVVKYWGYFLNMDTKISRLSGLRILLFCSTDIKVIGLDKSKLGYKIEPNHEQTLELMDSLYAWLNEFTDKYMIDESINKELSFKIASVLFDTSVEEIIRGSGH